MAQGLDELVEWLVGEVSFYGDGQSNPPQCIVASPVHAAILQLGRFPSRGMCMHSVAPCWKSS